MWLHYYVLKVMCLGACSQDAFARYGCGSVS